MKHVIEKDYENWYCGRLTNRYPNRLRTCYWNISKTCYSKRLRLKLRKVQKFRSCYWKGRGKYYWESSLGCEFDWEEEKDILLSEEEDLLLPEHQQDNAWLTNSCWVHRWLFVEQHEFLLCLWRALCLCAHHLLINGLCVKPVIKQWSWCNLGSIRNTCWGKYGSIQNHGGVIRDTPGFHLGDSYTYVSARLYPSHMLVLLCLCVFHMFCVCPFAYILTLLSILALV